MGIVIFIIGLIVLVWGLSIISEEPWDFWGYLLVFAGLFISFSLPEKARNLFERIKKKIIKGGKNE